MPTVGELSGPYTSFMLNPLPPTAADVCSTCMTFTQGYPTCYPCGQHAQYADAVLPISYSVHFGPLHAALAGYKRSSGRAARMRQLELAAVLWRFLHAHEQCLSRYVGAAGFDLVTTVPSGSQERDANHPLHRLVGTTVELTRDRYERLLTRSGVEVADRTVDPSKYDSTRGLDGEDVLLIDDTWTTGANAQSASGTLKRAGAGRIGVVVIGRHVHDEYGDNADRLKAISQPFDWHHCALE